jgi:hypothetical protein
MITIGFSTRKVDDIFVEMLKKTSGIPNTEVIPIENNGEYSLTETYNKILNQSKNDIVILCHDDIYFDSKNWGQKILNHFKRNSDYGIIGLAGTTNMPKSAKWWEDFSKMKGIVNHEHEGKKWESKYSVSKGNQLDDVVLVDGLLISINKKNIKKPFNDEIGGFHFYDVDFSFRNFIEGVKIGVMYDVRVTHKSIGQTNDQWEKNREIFAEKYKDVLPVKVKRKIEKNCDLRVLVFGKDYYQSEQVLNHLKKLNLSVGFCGELEDEKIIKKLKSKSIGSYKMYEPCGFKLGDGSWGFNTNDGFVKSEVNKLYKLQELNYDLIHIIDGDLKTMVRSLYPNADIFYKDKNYISEEEIINDYKEFLND